MLNQLLETKQAAQRKTGGTVVSLILHVLVIAAAVQFTRQSATAGEKPIEVVVKTPIKPVEPKQIVQKRPLDAVVQNTTPLGFRELPRVVDVPLDIPPVDLSATATNAADWTGTGVKGGTSTGSPDAVAPVDAGQPLFPFEVEKPAVSIPGTAGPAYPEMLKSSGVEGEALVQFVVDTLGRAEPGSFRVLRTTHAAFGESVRTALPRMRFLPAETGGRKVRMLVQQPFAFALNR
jgi:periplasmic protein TonB